MLSDCAYLRDPGFAIHCHWAAASTLWPFYKLLPWPLSCLFSQHSVHKVGSVSLECEATFGAGWQDWLLEHPWGYFGSIKSFRERESSASEYVLCVLYLNTEQFPMFSFFLFLLSPCLNLFAVPFTSLSNLCPKGKNNPNFNFLPLTRLIRGASSRNQGWVMLWLLQFCDSNQVWGF